MPRLFASCATASLASFWYSSLDCLRPARYPVTSAEPIPSSATPIGTTLSQLIFNPCLPYNAAAAQRCRPERSGGWRPSAAAGTRPMHHFDLFGYLHDLPRLCVAIMLQQIVVPAGATDLTCASLQPLLLRRRGSLARCVATAKLPGWGLSGHERINERSWLRALPPLCGAPRELGLATFLGTRANGVEGESRGMIIASYKTSRNGAA
jgi:hypothetical protein